MAALQNLWHHRRVADNASKACWICYRPSTSVLITPDNKDFFYICPEHLQDRNFCVPEAGSAAAAAAAAEEKRKKEELEKQIAAVKAEYEAKQKRRREKSKDKDKKSDSKDTKTDEDEAKKEEKEKEEKIKKLEEGEEKKTTAEGPRIFELQRNFYRMRVDRILNADRARKNAERLKNPSAFPSVPSNDL